MKTQFTPGIWSYRYDGDHWNDKDSFYVCANPTSAIGGQRDIALVLGEYTKGSTESNARLMAAAPAMFEALQALLSHMDRINPPSLTYWSGSEDQEKARAIITAARGDA